MKNNFEDLKKQFLGKVVRFTENVEEIKSIFYDPQMKTKITDMKLEEQENGDLVIKVTTDFSDFHKYNRFWMQANFFDSYGAPRLTWEESDCFPPDRKCTIYLMLNGEYNFTKIIELVN